MFLLAIITAKRAYSAYYKNVYLPEKLSIWSWVCIIFFPSHLLLRLCCWYGCWSLNNDSVSFIIYWLRHHTFGNKKKCKSILASRLYSKIMSKKKKNKKKVYVVHLLTDSNWIRNYYTPVENHVLRVKLSAYL